MDANTIYLALFLYFIVGSIIARQARRKLGSGVNDFFLAGRALGGVIAALTYSATTYSAFMLVGLAGFTYIGGVGALGFELIYLSGLILVAFFGPRFWLVGNRYNYLTPTEMLGDRYESRAVSIVSAVAANFSNPVQRCPVDRDWRPAGRDLRGSNSLYSRRFGCRSNCRLLDLDGRP